MRELRLQQLAVVVAVLALVAAVRPAVCREQQNNGTVEVAGEETRSARATAVIVFGDSIVDPGNNNNLHTQIKANHAPYGKDFDGHLATGRFSNGLVPSDLLAQKLHVKKLVAPWLNVDHTPEDLLTGVSFASGATGYDPLTPKIVSVITLEQQLEYFDEYRDKLVAIAGEEEAERIIDGAFFFVCAGSDDIANTYFTTPFRSVQYDIPSYVDLLLVGVDKFLRSVSARGAKRIGFVGLPPIGCVPSQRTVGGGFHRRCEPKRNYAAQLYNSRVQELIDGMKEELNTRIVYLGIYDIIQELAEDGERWGFTETTHGCCGTGLIEVTNLCDSRFMAVCDDVSKHVFFDSFHPTQRAYKIIVDNMWDTYGHLL
ncbi:GDSL esterase/lipase EXL3-like [Triticum dicoccoides]|uniref:GDSL esterase/lipase EXL3-like n=1 Tax=Triticum dicoccoides TaxID=85692 RepID=UPI00162E0E26|nr:GDSL esterase/lipase EXL3-like [Triticum dicoccoides]